MVGAMAMWVVSDGLPFLTAGPLEIMGSSSSKDAAALPSGLTSDEARSRLAKSGPNAVPDPSVRPLRRALTKFWAPVPWMLEAAIVLELALWQVCRSRNHCGAPRI